MTITELRHHLRDAIHRHVIVRCRLPHEQNHSRSRATSCASDDPVMLSETLHEPPVLAVPVFLHHGTTHFVTPIDCSIAAAPAPQPLTHAQLQSLGPALERRIRGLLAAFTARAAARIPRRPPARALTWRRYTC